MRLLLFRVCRSVDDNFPTHNYYYDCNIIKLTSYIKPYIPISLYINLVDLLYFYHIEFFVLRLFRIDWPRSTNTFTILQDIKETYNLHC